MNNCTTAHFVSHSVETPAVFCLSQFKVDFLKNHNLFTASRFFKTMIINKTTIHNSNNKPVSCFMVLVSNLEATVRMIMKRECTVTAPDTV